MTASPLVHPETDTRGRIVETAERFFREIGYQKTTVADIAKALRMSPANVYRFFESKKAINEAVAERMLANVEEQLEAIATGPGSAAERLRTFIETYHRLSVDRFTENHRMHEMVEVAMTESWAVIQAHIERTDAFFRRIVGDGAASGEFTAVPDIAVSARCAHVALIRYIHPQLLVQCIEGQAPALSAMADFVLAGLGYRATP
ncbi:MAG TPA: TetR family transcriptional regulator [Microvirga sp.]|jgi:AcrR family transcriptional regulator|nr:TetR family transcriptional regulator [Microvirga sp.]